MSFSIPLTKPYYDEKLLANVERVLKSGFWTEGAETQKLEQMFSDYLDVPFSIAVTSCTTGLELALKCVGVGPGDEVIVPDFTYPATIDAVLRVGATAVIVDVDPKTMVMSPSHAKAAITPKTKAIMPVSAFGNPLEYDVFSELCQQTGLVFIEDAAPSLGAAYRGRKTGSWADISVFSLHPRKFISTGEGGVVTTHNPAYADWMRKYKKFGLGENSDGMIDFLGEGTNLKMSDILAAVGVRQMELVHPLLEARTSLAKTYIEKLADIQGVTLPVTTEGGVHSYQSFTVFVEARDRIKDALRAAGIEGQIGTYSMQHIAAFSDHAQIRFHGDLSGGQYAFTHCLTLPLFYDMNSDQVDQVVATLKRVL